MAGEEGWQNTIGSERHLRRNGGAEVLMSFEDVERVIGAILPKSASLAA